MGVATIAVAAVIGTAGGKFTAVRSLLSAAPLPAAMIVPAVGIITTAAGTRRGSLAAGS